MSERRQLLAHEAMVARENAYAPYSKYAVGAALIGSNGKIYTGCNVENASYGLTNCAERTAVFSMVADGCQQIEAIAIATENSGSPCGACRQVLAEFSADIPVYFVDAQGNIADYTLYQLLPFHFAPDRLP
jgi:cytidine deaminase